MFDVLTVAAVADEISATLLDGRVQRVGLVDARTLAAEIYAGGRRRYLVASADDRRARLHLAATMSSLDAELVTPFGLLLRKYVRGGVLVGVEQPPLERLVRLSIAKRLPPHNGRRGQVTEGADEDGTAQAVPLAEEDKDDAGFGDGEGDATFVHLAVELMGRHSNLILVDDDGRVMESAKRVTAAMSRVRPVLPRLPYAPPPPVDKPDPRRLTASDAATLLATEPPTAELAGVLVRRLRGVSPQMAREIVFRVVGNAAAKISDLPPDAAPPLARETRALLEPLLTSAWSPRVYREGPPAESPASPPEGEEEREAGAVVAFSAVPLAHLGVDHAEQTVDSVSVAAELALGEGTGAGPVRHTQRRERLLEAVRAERARQERRLAALREQGAKAAEAEQLRERGELIYAYLWQIRPGQTELVVDGATVPLDPELDAKANAQAYFERYRKARDAAAHLPDLQAGGEAQLAYLDQLLTLTEQATGFAELDTLQAEWEARNGPRRDGEKPRRRAPDRRPRPLRDPSGNAVYIGRSGAQNDQVTFDLAGPNDTWLHARGVPGSHVVIRWRGPGDEEDPDTVEAAAALAAFYSAARSSATVEVDATRRRHVRKIKGAGPGMVTYRNERTLAVRPADEAGVARVLRADRSG
ncbi:MAG: NFACT family protein [Chloroflexota bacterium]|nr:NFACT family protein [Chloroflexota bacterium]